MTTLTEGMHPFEFCISEASGNRSREEITILSGEDLDAGTVLGIVTASGKYVAFNQDGADGSENAAGILGYPCDATGGDKQAAIIRRDAEVNSSEITWPSDIDAGEKTAAIAELTALGIILRDVV